jgi:Domain of unknown function (DUF4124)
MLCAVRTCTVFLGFLLAAAAAAGPPPAFRWVDADGVHYSDQPHPGAEQITLSQTQTYSSAQADTSSASAGAAPRATRESRDTGDFRYDSCAVIQPAQDQMLIDVESANIAVRVQPAKRSGDRVVLSMDGQAIEPKNDDQVEFLISPIDRGTHTVAATVRSADGKSLCQSPSLTFHVRQPSARKPASMNRPTPH